MDGFGRRFQRIALVALMRIETRLWNSKSVGIYFGSRNEWSRDPSPPINEGLPYPAPRYAA